MRKRMSRVLGTGMMLLSVLLLTGTSFAADYYVATSGNDGNAGTQSAPLQHIQAGIDRAAPGDTVWVGPGVYSETIVMGSPGVRVISTSGPAGTVIEGIASESGVVLWTGLSLPNPILEGFWIRANPGGGTGVVFNSGPIPIDQSAVLKNCIITGVARGISVYPPASPTILNNTLFGGSPLGGDYGIRILDNTSSPVIRNNIILNYPIAGIAANGFTGVIAYNNVFNNVYDNTVNYSGMADMTGISGNISDYPFINTVDLSLLPGSPGINEGDPDPLYNDADGTRNDMGAYGGNYSGGTPGPCPAFLGGDSDGDGVCGSVDNCPNEVNPDQADQDGDGFGDLCDVCPTTLDDGNTPCPEPIAIPCPDCIPPPDPVINPTEPFLASAAFTFSPPTPVTMSIATLGSSLSEPVTFFIPECHSTKWTVEMCEGTAETCGGPSGVWTPVPLADVTGPPYGIVPPAPADAPVPFLLSELDPNREYSVTCDLTPRMPPGVLTPPAAGGSRTFRYTAQWSSFVTDPDIVVDPDTGEKTCAVEPCYSNILVGESAETEPATIVLENPTRVDIDIKPGSPLPKTIALGSNGNIPVAILGSGTFDVQNVDPYSVTLQGLQVKLKGKALSPMASITEINGDAYPDMLMHIDTTGLSTTQFSDEKAILKGKTYSGEIIEGSNTVKVVSQ